MGRYQLLEEEEEEEEEVPEKETKENQSHQKSRTEKIQKIYYLHKENENENEHENGNAHSVSRSSSIDYCSIDKRHRASSMNMEDRNIVNKEKNLIEDGNQEEEVKILSAQFVPKGDKKNNAENVSNEYTNVFDPFQRFDDFYAIGPSTSSHAVQLATDPLNVTSARNNDFIGNPPWIYDYFHTDENQKSKSGIGIGNGNGNSEDSTEKIKVGGLGDDNDRSLSSMYVQSHMWIILEIENNRWDAVINSINLYNFFIFIHLGVLCRVMSMRRLMSC